MKKNLKITFLVLVFGLILSACGGEASEGEGPGGNQAGPIDPDGIEDSIPPTPTAEPPKVAEIRNQQYIADDSDQHQLDIYIPPVPIDQYPTIILLHGGGSSKAAMLSWGYHFAEQGFTSVAVEFRDYPDYTYPDAVEDVFCAAAWMQLNAEEFGFNTSHLVVIGHSVGGTLASMLAVVDQPETFLTACPHPWSAEIKIIGAAAFTGVFDYPTLAEGREDIASYVESLLGGTIDEVPEIWTQASPQSWITGSEPPFLL
ncbi:MAG: alpha/beta hydrolase, partial [Chloroflexota bacterium]